MQTLWGRKASRPVARFCSVPDERKSAKRKPRTPERNAMSARSIFYAWMNGDITATEANQMFEEAGSSMRIVVK